MFEDFLIKNGVLFKYKDQAVHPILTSGYHSDTYFNTTKLIESASLTQMALKNMFESKIRSQLVSKSCNSIGGLLTLGSHIAYVITETLLDFRCKQRIVFNKKDSPVVSYWKLEDIKEPLLLVDDVLSTGSSFKHLIPKLEGITLSPYIIVIVNRLGKDEITIGNRTFKIISVYNLKCNIWEPSECPLCKNSKGLKPKTNWDIFSKIS